MSLALRRKMVNPTSETPRILGEDELSILSRYIVDRARAEQTLVTVSVDSIGRPFVTTKTGPAPAQKVQADHPAWHVGTYNGQADPIQVADDIRCHMDELRSTRNVA